MQNLLLIVLIMGAMYIGVKLVSKIREMARWEDEGDSVGSKSGTQPADLKSLTPESDHLDNISQLDDNSHDLGEKKNLPPN